MRATFNGPSRTLKSTQKDTLWHHVTTHDLTQLVLSMFSMVVAGYSFQLVCIVALCLLCS